MVLRPRGRGRVGRRRHLIAGKAVSFYWRPFLFCERGFTLMFAGRILAERCNMTRFGLLPWALAVAYTGAGAQALPPPELIRTTYISVNGPDTLWQNVIRTTRSFQSDVLIPAAGASVKLTALLDPRALIRQLELDVWRGIGTPNQIHSQSASFAVTDDSVVGEVRGIDRRQPQRFPSPPGA